MRRLIVKVLSKVSLLWPQGMIIFSPINSWQWGYHTRILPAAWTVRNSFILPLLLRRKSWVWKLIIKKKKKLKIYSDCSSFWFREGRISVKIHRTFVCCRKSFSFPLVTKVSILKHTTQCHHHLCNYWVLPVQIHSVPSSILPYSTSVLVCLVLVLPPLSHSSPGLIVTIRVGHGENKPIIVL